MGLWSLWQPQATLTGPLSHLNPLPSFGHHYINININFNISPHTSQVSDEEFFQTVACNPHFPRDRMRTHNDNLRFVNWWGNQPSPAVVPPFRAVAAANSGAIFGRKFSSETPEGRDGIRWVEEYLAEPSKVSMGERDGRWACHFLCVFAAQRMAFVCRVAACRARNEEGWFVTERLCVSDSVAAARLYWVPLSSKIKCLVNLCRGQMGT